MRKAGHRERSPHHTEIETYPDTEIEYTYTSTENTQRSPFQICLCGLRVIKYSILFYSRESDEWKRNEEDEGKDISAMKNDMRHLKEFILNDSDVGIDVLEESIMELYFDS